MASMPIVSAHLDLSDASFVGPGQMLDINTTNFHKKILVIFIIGDLVLDNANHIGTHW